MWHSMVSFSLCTTTAGSDNFLRRHHTAIVVVSSRQLLAIGNALAIMSTHGSEGSASAHAETFPRPVWWAVLKRCHLVTHVLLRLQLN